MLKSHREPADSEPELQGKSIVELLRRLTSELLALFRQEMALATAEVTRTLTRLLAGVAAIAAGALVLCAGVLTLLAAAVLGLIATDLPPWLAALIVGGAVTLVGTVLVYIGQKSIQPSDLKPRRTVESLRQDKEVLMGRQS